MPSGKAGVDRPAKLVKSQFSRGFFIMKSTPIVFKVDQGPYHKVFSLKQINVKEDSDLIQRFIDIADEGDKSEATYKVKAEFLAEYATPFPTDLKKDGKKVARPDDALDSPEAMKAFFDDADVDKDWLSETAVNTLRNRHAPSVSFF